MNPFDPLETQGQFQPAYHAPTNTIAPTSPDALFHDNLENVVAGQVVNAKCIFPLRLQSLAAQGVSLNANSPPNVSVDWCLIDSVGVVYAQGYATEIRWTFGSMITTVEAMAVIPIPEGLPPTAMGQKYQLMWTLSGPKDMQALSSTYTSGLSVSSPHTHADLGNGGTNVTYGPTNCVELRGKKATVKLILDHTPEPGETVTATLYQGNKEKQNIVLTGDNAVPLQYTGFNAKVYEATFNSQTESLDDYSVVWTWKRDRNQQMATSRIWWITPSILSAMSAVQEFVAKAGAYTIGHPDAMFDDVTILNWLQRGRDAFNLATGRMTSFTMMDATGTLREFWLRYSEMGACRSQSLAEAEKAFNFSSGATSLDVDKAAAYESAASSLDSQIQQDIGVFKQNLLIKGITGGNGNMSNTPAPNLAVVGIALTPANQTRFRYIGR